MSGVEIAGLVAIVDICVNRGTQLYHICKSFSRAEQDILERAVRIKTCWIRIHHQLEIMTQQVVDVMGNDLEHNLAEILTLLVGKLDKCLRKIGPFLPKSSGASEGESIQPLARTPSQQFALKTRFVLRVKEPLDQAIDDLETWQKIFDPSWFLTIKALSPVVANLTTLRSGSQSLTERFPSVSGLEPTQTNNTLMSQSTGFGPFFLDPEDIEIGSVIDAHLPFSQVCFGRRKDKRYLLDSVACRQGPEAKVYAKDVRNLAKKLATADPVFFNLLTCKGVMKGRETFTFVFNVPKNLDEPQSLRALLLAGRAPTTLTDRFQVARDLVRSVLFVHYYSYVHKNIRPETIWLLRRTSGTGPELSTFLLGFEEFRHDDGRTGNLGDMKWERNIYRHPQRQGLRPQEIYTMQHDIYSIGVCLLEIGLWKSFVLYEDGSSAGSPSGLFKEALDAADIQDTSLIQLALLNLAQQRLPQTMGVRYSKVVQTCLTCLDTGNSDFGDSSEFEDEDGLLVGMRYIQKVHGRLLDIQV